MNVWLKCNNLMTDYFVLFLLRFLLARARLTIKWSISSPMSSPAPCRYYLDITQIRDRQLCRYVAVQICTVLAQVSTTPHCWPRPSPPRPRLVTTSRSSRAIGRSYRQICRYVDMQICRYVDMQISGVCTCLLAMISSGVSLSPESW